MVGQVDDVALDRPSGAVDEVVDLAYRASERITGHGALAHDTDRWSSNTSSAQRVSDRPIRHSGRSWLAETATRTPAGDAPICVARLRFARGVRCGRYSAVSRRTMRSSSLHGSDGSGWYSPVASNPVDL